MNHSLLMNSDGAASFQSQPIKLLASYTDAELLYYLDRILHVRDPLRIALDTLPHHFSLAIAPLHRQIVSLAFNQRDFENVQGSESRVLGITSTLPCSTSIPPSPP